MTGAFLHPFASPAKERFTTIVLEETLGRSASPKEGHFGPPGYHTVFAIILLWPGSMRVALAIPRAWLRARVRRPRRDAEPGLLFEEWEE